MSKSYQQEIPQARVNITLDVETGANQSKKELPMKLLMLGDYSHGQAVGTISERERININKQNFNQILSAFSPKLTMTVADRIQNQGNELPVELEFNDFSDFKPENIVAQVPQLKRLMAMRNLLKDLKSCVIDNQTFRKELEKIMKSSESTQQLLSELTQSAPLANAEKTDK